MVRPHHPLLGRKLEVLRDGDRLLVVRLPDGCGARIPRAWTDADGAPPPRPEPETILTAEALREILSLVESLRRAA